MSVFEALSLMFTFAMLILTLLAYINKNDSRRR